MKKSLDQILNDPVSTDDLIRTQRVIDKMIADSEEEGVEWPELEEDEDDDPPEHGICPLCSGTGCYCCRHTGEV